MRVGDSPLIHQALAVTCVRKCWEYRIPAVVGTIDISRAFATIPHSLILEGLSALQVDSCTITLVAAILDTAALEICTNTRETFQLPLRGVLSKAHHFQ